MTKRVTVSVVAIPVGERKPDADTNVLLFLSDGSSCEGFLDDDGEGNPIWRDVTAEALEGGVTHWAAMPALDDVQSGRAPPGMENRAWPLPGGFA